MTPILDDNHPTYSMHYTVQYINVNSLTCNFLGIHLPKSTYFSFTVSFTFSTLLTNGGKKKICFFVLFCDFVYGHACE